MPNVKQIETPPIFTQADASHMQESIRTAAREAQAWEKQSETTLPALTVVRYARRFLPRIRRQSSTDGTSQHDYEAS